MLFDSAQVYHCCANPGETTSGCGYCVNPKYRGTSKRNRQDTHINGVITRAGTDAKVKAAAALLPSQPLHLWRAMNDSKLAKKLLPILKALP